MVQPGDVLTVVFRGVPIGRVDVDESYPTHFFGWFHPGPGYDAGRDLFDRAIDLSRRFDEAADRDEALAIMAENDAVTREITASVRLPELGEEVGEFGIHRSGEVEITLERAPG